MKVLIINDYADIVGGAERFLENLLHESEKAAIDFHRLDIADQLKERAAATKSNFFTRRYNRINIIPKVVKLVTRYIEEIRPDLIHLNNNHLYTNSIIQSLNTLGIPVVWFVHDYYTLRRLQSFLYLQAKTNFTFLTHSPDIHEGLIAMARKTYLVKVPFNYAKWTRPQANDNGHRPIDLLYVGRIEKSKGVFTLVKAVDRIRQRLPSISLSILGDGTQRKALESMVRGLKLESNIEIMGLQEDQPLRLYYARARILVFPSATETLGYVGLEAQACGTPVIAFENEGTSRWCRDNIDGFIVHGGSAQKLADKVLEIIHDDVILTRISTAARENIRLEGYNASSQEVPDIYKAILSW
ncbi:MAG: glycosyltransferase family 4 protein [Saprospiraceae bacterium]|nr:glycosyltransferase family 4 protein [Candidatus Opimibacter iunctus]